MASGPRQTPLGRAAMEIVRASTLLLAAGAAVVAILCLGGAVSAGMDMLTHFVPFLLLAAVLALVLTLAFGGGAEPTALLLATVATAICAGLMAPEAFAALTAPRAPPQGQTIKVIQWNLWSYNSDPQRSARWLAAQDADVVILEEVTGRAGAVPALVAEVYPFRTPCNQGHPCTTYILSKLPPAAAGDYPSPDDMGRHSGAWARFGEGPGTFAVVGLHHLWPAPPGPQQAQTRVSAGYLAAFDRASLIVGGDFNSAPWSFALRRQDALFGLERRSRMLFSWPLKAYSRYRIPSPFPLMPIDHVYAGSDWKTVSIAKGPRVGSDHTPIIAVLTRPKEPA